MEDTHEAQTFFLPSWWAVMLPTIAMVFNTIHFYYTIVCVLFCSSIMHAAQTHNNVRSPFCRRESSKRRSRAVPSNAFRYQPVSEFIDCSELPAVDLSLGMNKLCQQNFGNNRQPIAFENYAGIIGSSVGLLSAHAHDLCGYAPV